MAPDAQHMVFLDCSFPKLTYWELMNTLVMMVTDYQSSLWADSYSLWRRSGFATSGGSKAKLVYTPHWY